MSQEKKPVSQLNDISKSAWEKFSVKKIYFGHMSVGFNIIDGVRLLAEGNPGIKLNLVETNDFSDIDTPVFAHSRIGKNHDPISKIDAFRQFMDGGIGDNADIAFFKFCFVDITEKTDINKVFSHYMEVMDYLAKKYGKTNFIHVTVPLTTVQSGPKAFVKRIIDRPIDGYADNIKRNEFNDMLRKEYEGKAPIYDLALIESSSLKGVSVLFTKDGKSFSAMNPDFTHDRGHLNDIGRKLAAQRLLVLLATLSDKK